MRPFRESKWARLGRQLLVAVAVILVWHVFVATRERRSVLAQSPMRVGEEAWRLVTTGELASNLQATMTAVAIALLLACLTGIAFGLFLALVPSVEAVVSPYLNGLNSMPRVALAPVFIVVFGIGITAKVALAYSVVVFMLIISARAGVNSADPDLLRLVTVMDANRRQRFFKVLLPVALPSIFGGIRLAVIYSLLGVVTSELISAQDGVGQLIAMYSSQFNLAPVYALLIILAIIAGFMNAMTGALERWALRWQPEMVTSGKNT